MKLIGLIIVGILAFVLTLTIALATTGNLNQEAITRMVQGAPPAVSDEKEDDLDALSDALAKREDQLRAQKKRMDTLLDRQQRTQQETKELRDNVQQIMKDLSLQLDASDEDQTKKLLELALSIAAMDADNAARVLGDMDPERAAGLLRLMDEDVRGEILDSLVQEDRASQILNYWQASDY